MNKKIYVSFPPDMFRDLKEQATNRINKILEGINTEVNGWNGFVDFIDPGSGQYEFIAKCDNDDIREKMQLLLDTSGINKRQAVMANGNRQTVNVKRQ